MPDIATSPDPADLLGHCPTFSYEQAGYVIQPPAPGADRGRVFFYGDRWHAVAALDTEDDVLHVTTIDGDQVLIGAGDVVEIAY
jgi:hypothetical protein